MADRTVLTNGPEKRNSLRILTWLLWVTFLAGNVVLIALQFTAASAFTVLLSELLLLLMLVTEIGLLLRYWGRVGQWRVVVLFWASYSLARLVTDYGLASGWEVVTLVAMLLVLYAGVAGWVSMIVLAIRRDVSVAYMVLAFVIAPVVLRAQIMQAGGVLAWLQNQQSGEALAYFTMAEPVYWMLSCMVPLALLTVVPHFVWLWVKEWQRRAL